MKIKVVVHDAEEGGFWAEVPAIPGCASQGDTMDELLANIQEAIEGCLSTSRDCLYATKAKSSDGDASQPALLIPTNITTIDLLWRW